jgi:hypothetical protein
MNKKEGLGQSHPLYDKHFAERILGMKVGDTVYIFDINRRVYRKEGGGPIWEEHWRPEVIESETSRSWVTRNGRKIPKTGKVHGVAFSLDDVRKDGYVNDNAYKIARLINSNIEYEKLVEIAKIVGYEPVSYEG